MNAMQYVITLPADYDMGIIRARVATRGHLLDTLSGLTLKAYCIQERGIDGVSNQYAPFYLWHDVRAMLGFLRGPGFRGVIDSFGTPSVRHWVVVAADAPTAATSAARWATRRTVSIPEGVDVQQSIESFVYEADARPSTGLSATAVALDPRRWELVRFSLWTEEPPLSGDVRYQVLHVSTPLLTSRS